MTVLDLREDDGEAASVERALSDLGLVLEADSGWAGLSACAGLGACTSARADVRAAATARAAARAPGAPAEHWAACPRRCGERPGTPVAVAVVDAGVAVRRGADEAARARRRRRARRAARPRVITYERDGAAIYRESFATIRAEADLAGLDPVLERVVVRMIHACGMVDLADDVAASPRFGEAARAALRAGAADPVRHRDGRGRRDPRAAARGQRGRLHAGRARRPGARATGWARRAARPRSSTGAIGSSGAVAVIGNAPTALFRLLELVEEGAPRPAAVIGVPVGFVGAAESKLALAEHPAGLEHLVVHGRRGGSAMAAAAVNALATEAE